jgi:hypothetical protein
MRRISPPEYASTTFPDDFKRAVSRALRILPNKITQMRGVRRAVGVARKINVYIAAQILTMWIVRR